MEFNFDYYWWLQNIDKEPPIMVFVSSFGVIGVLIVLALIRLLIKKIGFKRLADSTILDGIMVSLGLAGFFGFIIIMLLIFSIHQMSLGNEEEHLGIRFVLIWITLFIFILFFYFSKRNMLKKWFDGITAFNRNTDEKEVKSNASISKRNKKSHVKKK